LDIDVIHGIAECRCRTNLNGYCIAFKMVLSRHYFLRFFNECAASIDNYSIITCYLRWFYFTGLSYSSSCM